LHPNNLTDDQCLIIWTLVAPFPQNVPSRQQIVLNVRHWLEHHADARALQVIGDDAWADGYYDVSTFLRQLANTRSQLN
jgi:hypothetical protein